MDIKVTLTLSDELNSITKRESEDIGISQAEFVQALIVLGLKDYIKILTVEK